MTRDQTDPGVVVVGGGIGGGRLVEMLAARGNGDLGPLTLVSGEANRPYDRTRVSKDCLSQPPGADVYFREPGYYASHGVSMLLGQRVAHLDPQTRSLTLTSGEQITYRRLVLATGSANRTLDVPGSDLPGVHYLRDLRDSTALAADLAADKTLVVIGGGFIGCEVAAQVRPRGIDVTVVEVADEPMSRILGPDAARLVRKGHERRGVTFRTGAAVVRLLGDDRVRQVELDDGTVLDADVVVIGIGVHPATDWLEGSGLERRDGIPVDRYCQAAPDIYAIGDIARWQHPLYGELRVEHETHAQNQAMALTRTLLGQPSPYEATPYVWSDQGDMKLRFVGYCPEPHEVISLAQSPERCVSAYLADDRVHAVFVLNDEQMAAKAQRLLARGPVPVDDYLALL
jgi:3-phenylpropionate/trans-cinnamate dioxygenase ferredoxin reductase subunit